MDTLPRIKPSRIRRIREIDNLLQEAKEVQMQFNCHVKDRKRIARKARRLAKKVRKKYPDMRLAEDPFSLSLHDHLNSLAKLLHVPANESDLSSSDYTLLKISGRFEELFGFLKKIMDVPWLDPIE
jgi:hypothetical protein